MPESTVPVIEWAIGVYNPDGYLVSVVPRREHRADRFRPLHTEETARADREEWVGPYGAWSTMPERIRVLSRTITPWSPS